MHTHDYGDMLGSFLRWADLRQMWLDGEYFPLLYTRAAIESAVERRIVLTPAK